MKKCHVNNKIIKTLVFFSLMRFAIIWHLYFGTCRVKQILCLWLLELFLWCIPCHFKRQSQHLKLCYLLLCLLTFRQCNCLLAIQILQLSFQISRGYLHSRCSSTCSLLFQQEFNVSFWLVSPLTRPEQAWTVRLGKMGVVWVDRRPL